MRLLGTRCEATPRFEAILASLARKRISHCLPAVAGSAGLAKAFGVRSAMSPRIAFGRLRASPKESTCDKKFVSASGHMRRHIILRLTAFMSLPRQRCIENGSLIRARNWTFYAIQLSSWRKTTPSAGVGPFSPITILWCSASKTPTRRIAVLCDICTANWRYGSTALIPHPAGE